MQLGFRMRSVAQLPVQIPCALWSSVLSLVDTNLANIQTSVGQRQLDSQMPSAAQPPVRMSCALWTSVLLLVETNLAHIQTFVGRRQLDLLKQIAVQLPTQIPCARWNTTLGIVAPATVNIVTRAQPKPQGGQRMTADCHQLLIVVVLVSAMITSIAATNLVDSVFLSGEIAPIRNARIGSSAETRTASMDRNAAVHLVEFAWIQASLVPRQFVSSVETSFVRSGRPAATRAAKPALRLEHRAL